MLILLFFTLTNKLLNIMNNEQKLSALMNLPTEPKIYKRFKKWQSVFVSRTDRMKGRKIKSK